MAAPQVSIKQVVELLKKGMSPDELMQYGVPEEMINQALMVIQQEGQQNEMGLAQRFVQEPRI